MFHASEDSLDDLMRAVFEKLLTGRGNFEVISKKGRSTEIFGALLELKNPRERLSRSFSKAKAFSPLGELFWYLSGSDDVNFIKYYIPTYPKLIGDEVKANGAYGPRIFGLNAAAKNKKTSNWDRVIRTLRARPGSRNALIQIYANSDAKPKNGDKPCTCSIQFAIRNGRLLMHTHMRSNDAFFGLPHDIFTFTMLQEIAARELGVGLGSYTHSVASLHLYHDSAATGNYPANHSMSRAKKYHEEGLHDSCPMPEMPLGDPWSGIEEVRIAEKQIRSGNTGYQAPEGLNQYWCDFINLFKIYRLLKGNQTSWQDMRKIVEITKQISPTYRIYIFDKLQRTQPSTRELFNYMMK